MGSVELPEKIDIPLESHLECKRECWASSSVGLGLLAPFLALDSKTTPTPKLGAAVAWVVLGIRQGASRDAGKLLIGGWQPGIDRAALGSPQKDCHRGGLTRACTLFGHHTYCMPVRVLTGREKQEREPCPMKPVEAR